MVAAKRIQTAALTATSAPAASSVSVLWKQMTLAFMNPSLSHSGRFAAPGDRRRGPADSGTEPLLINSVNTTQELFLSSRFAMTLMTCLACMILHRVTGLAHVIFHHLMACFAHLSLHGSHVIFHHLMVACLADLSCRPVHVMAGTVFGLGNRRAHENNQCTH